MEPRRPAAALACQLDVRFVGNGSPQLAALGYRKVYSAMVAEMWRINRAGKRRWGLVIYL
ncbi:hypothetical protein ACF1D3_06930 [Streptomyces sp. NPDC014728]|uniref:hypothetical protein n=1 Tax=unclassified Streptomyces TaxID=2593676 RepID=UPI0036F92BB1